MKLYFDDENFDGQLQRSVGKCDSGMANVGECLYIASQITPGDRDSWYQQWSAFADKLVQQADAARRSRSHGERPRLLPAGRRVLPPSVLLAPRRPRCGGASDRLRRRASRRFATRSRCWTRPAPCSTATPPATSSRRPATGPSRPSSTSGATTAPPRRTSRQPARRLIGAGRSPASMVPAQESRCTSDASPMRPDWEHVVPGMVDIVLAPTRRRSRTDRAGRSVVWWSARAPRRVG